MVRSKVLLMTVLLITPLGFAKTKTGFDGKWMIDGDPGGGDAPKNLVQNIKQKGNDINIDSQFAEPSNGIVPLLYLGVMANKVMLSTDGSERQNQIGPFQLAAKNTLDGNTMKTEWTAVVQGKTVNGNWVRTLSDDGKHMTMEVHESTEGQDRQATLQFKRK